MPDQADVDNLGGTMRLGLFPCDCCREALAQRAYGNGLVYERHRHRYELNNEYR